ncbi:fad dependent oxidoreductase protein [Rutstroemia sp. NJR-2017a WRK4]|nr:fad dependent oxidoreductase protein [Rutstroemia sp. NJR-2017a WRK4]
MAESKTLATEVVKSSDDEIVFKLQQFYKPKALPTGKTVDKGDQEKVIYHKDMWNEKDYSHEGLGNVLKKLNGDHLTKITQPPESL